MNKAQGGSDGRRKSARLSSFLSTTTTVAMRSSAALSMISDYANDSSSSDDSGNTSVIDNRVNGRRAEPEVVMENEERRNNSDINIDLSDEEEEEGNRNNSTIRENVDVSPEVMGTPGSSPPTTAIKRDTFRPKRKSLSDKSFKSYLLSPTYSWRKQGPPKTRNVKAVPLLGLEEEESAFTANVNTDEIEDESKKSNGGGQVLEESAILPPHQQLGAAGPSSRLPRRSLRIRDSVGPVRTSTPLHQLNKKSHGIQHHAGLVTYGQGRISDDRKRGYVVFKRHPGSLSPLCSTNEVVQTTPKENDPPQRRHHYRKITMAIGTPIIPNNADVHSRQTRQPEAIEEQKNRRQFNFANATTESDVPAEPRRGNRERRQTVYFKSPFVCPEDNDEREGGRRTKIVATPSRRTQRNRAYETNARDRSYDDNDELVGETRNRNRHLDNRNPPRRRDRSIGRGNRRNNDSMEDMYQEIIRKAVKDELDARMDPMIPHTRRSMAVRRQTISRRSPPPSPSPPPRGTGRQSVAPQRHRDYGCERGKSTSCPECDYIGHGMAHLMTHYNSVHKGVRVYCPFCHNQYKLSSANSHANACRERP